MNTFNPLDYVTITLFGLNYQGRVTERIITPSGELYLVEYAQDGDIKQGRFRGDELVAQMSNAERIAMRDAIRNVGARMNPPIPRAEKAVA